MAVSELTECSWANILEGLLTFTRSVKKPNMTYNSSGKIWFDIIDVELLTPADETSCNTCLTLYY